MNITQNIITHLLQSWGLTFLFVTFSFAFYLKTKKISVIDIFWGPFHFVQLSFLILLQVQNFRIESIIFFSIIYLWGMRLAVYLFIRSIGKPEDERYLNLAKHWTGNMSINVYFRVFCGQFFILIFTSLSLSLIVLFNEFLHFSFLYICGLTVSLSGFLYESIADFQLLNFKRKNHGVKKVMDVGLWKYSRHPNYFGEIIFWWGIWLISMQTPFWYIGIISPMTISYLLTRFSGVPMLERRYENNPEYLAYIRSTNVLIPGKRKN